MRRDWALADLTLSDMRDRRIEVAVLPFGATEPHNLHLPYATDSIEVQAIADLACARANELGARVLLLPTIPFGTETNLARFPFALNLNPSTLLRVLADLLESLTAHSIRKVLLINGHGGNDFKWMLRELHGKTPAHLFLCNWYRVARDRHDELFKDAGDHAGEMETSLVLHLAPELARVEHADPGAIARSRFDAVRAGWVEITRPWHLLTTNSGAGDPRPASAEKGRRLCEIVVERIAKFLQELSASPLDESFPFEAQS